MQSTLIAGDSLSLLASGATYPASAGWLMKLRLVPRAQGAKAIQIDGQAEGDDHRLQAGSSVTNTWAAGQYSWARWAVKGDESHTIEQGQITILPDPRTSPVGTDTRSVAAKALDTAQQALADFRESKGLKRRYKIGDREMEFASTEEILREIRFWQRRVDDEEVAAGRRSKRAGVIKARL
jgi:hypothetical protein